MKTNEEIERLRAELEAAGVEQPVYDFVPLDPATPPRIYRPDRPVVRLAGLRRH